jgi:hypothetical protein
MIGRFRTFKRRRPVQRESREQQGVVMYFRVRWPEVPILCATRGKHLSGTEKWQRLRQGAQIKREGYERGTSDLFFCAARRGFHGLFIEMKQTGGRWSDVSDDQKKFLSRARAQGYYGAVAMGHENAIRIIAWYMKKNEKEIHAFFASQVPDMPEGVYPVRLARSSQDNKTGLSSL